MLCRCAWRFIYCSGPYTNVKFIFMPLVQWSWSIYFSWSTELCIYLLETQKIESQ
jgi:hypothetical protein